MKTEKKSIVGDKKLYCVINRHTHQNEHTFRRKQHLLLHPGFIYLAPHHPLDYITRFFLYRCPKNICVIIKKILSVSD